MTDPESLSPRDEFFIGWEPVPRGYARFLAPAVALVLAVGVAAAVALSLSQRSPGTGVWEDSERRTFVGVVTARPYPVLRVPGEPVRSILLVEEGKFGAAERVRPFEGQVVRATGTVLHREDRLMLELAPGAEGLSVSELPAGERERVLATRPERRGRVTLDGEIIDPKCYLGAMKPGGGKTHKACAALCLRGGVPPMLATRGDDGRERFHLLVSAEGGPMNDAAHPIVGEPVTVTGEEERDGDLLVLRVESNGIRRR